MDKNGEFTIEIDELNSLQLVSGLGEGKGGREMSEAQKRFIIGK